MDRNLHVFTFIYIGIHSVRTHTHSFASCHNPLKKLKYMDRLEVQIGIHWTSCSFFFEKKKSNAVYIFIHIHNGDGNGECADVDVYTCNCRANTAHIHYIFYCIQIQCKKLMYNLTSVSMNAVRNSHCQLHLFFGWKFFACVFFLHTIKFPFT